MMTHRTLHHNHHNVTIGLMTKTTWLVCWVWKTSRPVLLLFLLHHHHHDQVDAWSTAIITTTTTTIGRHVLPTTTTTTTHSTGSSFSSTSCYMSKKNPSFMSSTTSFHSSNPWTVICSRSWIVSSLLFLFTFFTFSPPSLYEGFQPSTQHLSTNPISTSTFTTSILPCWAEDELSHKYSTKGFDASLVDQSCLIHHCSLPAKTCLAEDADCRKGLVCTAKCLGNNACITGCMARYGNTHLDEFLKCTIEDHSCIQVAILPGGSDPYDQAPPAPVPTLSHFNIHSLEGTWYKVIGFNPNYDCYPCQRNTFSLPQGPLETTQEEEEEEERDKIKREGYWKHHSLSLTSSPQLEVNVEFSMPRMLPEDTPIPASLQRETISFQEEEDWSSSSSSSSSSGSSRTEELGIQRPMSIGLNDYQTHEVMVFDTDQSQTMDWNHLLTFGKGTNKNQVSYRRTAHSEGEMFGLKFWENWYIIGENDPGMQEFKFVYYNGKTRQNTYEGAFVYSRSKTLTPDALRKVYTIASDAGMNPHQFCKIQNGCFQDQQGHDNTDGVVGFLGSPSNPFRGILASTKVSQLLGVEPVAAEGVLKSTQTVSDKLRVGILQENEAKEEEEEREGSMGKQGMTTTVRAWHQELGDYLENPHRHFNAMDSLRVPMKWPDDIAQK